MILHPLSMAAVASRTPMEVPPAPVEVMPMSGSRRKAIYRRQGGKLLTPAQSRRYRHKVSQNGYIPKARVAKA